MVQAILEGRKTMTRRVVNFPEVWPDLLDDLHSKLVVKEKEVFDLKGESRFALRDRFGKPGDVLWVRESWYTDWIYNRLSPSELDGECKFYYHATLEKGSEGRLRPSIHMPKAACRIFLKVVNVRVERLQDISESDAIAEGIITKTEITGLVMGQKNDHHKNYVGHKSWVLPKDSFKGLWKSINGIESWDANPWVWVVEFERIEKPENFLS
jgi:hypothetical protein